MSDQMPVQYVVFQNQADNLNLQIEQPRINFKRKTIRVGR